MVQAQVLPSEGGKLLNKTKIDEILNKLFDFMRK